jgi:rhamnogalacturonan endolyase
VPVSRLSRLCILASLGSIALTLSGCAFSGAPIAATASLGSPTGSSSAAAKSAIGGTVHGGQQPIVGAAVTLWAAGTAGSYGTGATSVATTTTDANGNFSFNVSGASPCTTGQYLYVTSLGGNPSAGVNPYAALMAALPTPCGSTTASSFVTVNEVTTVASVTALQQFMSINPGNTPAWTIGAPSANVTGMANAFTQVGNLVSIATGTSAPVVATNTISSVTYTTTITPDTAKIYTMADVLAACINSTGSTTCNALFSDTTPGSASAPTDTIQVAYYLATNAAGLTMPAHGDPGSPSYLCSQYIVSSSPFPSATACNTATTGTYPTDWTIDVHWSGTNGTTTAASVAVDGSGNVWTSALTTGNLDVTEFNPAGQVIITPATTASVVGGWQYSTCTTCTTPVSLLGTHTGDAIAIDTNGNAWATSWNGTTNTISSQIEAPVVKIAPGGAASAYLVGYSPAGIAIDGNNNLYIGDGASTSASRYYESVAQATPTPVYSTLDAGTGRTTNGGYYWSSTVDQAGFVWPASDAGETSIPRTTNTGAASTVASTTALPAAVYYLAADASGNAWGSTTTATSGATGLEYINVASSIVSPTVATFPIGTNGSTQGGLFAPQGMAIDGTGNLWVVNSNGAAGGGISEFVPSNNGTTLTPLSPSGTGVWGFFSGAALNTPIGAAIDSSGDVWFKTKGGSNLYYLVGVASPVVTPLSVMVKNSFIAERPGATMLASLSSSLSFASLTTSNQSQTATLTNTGTAPIKFTGTTITGTNPSDFTVSNTTCGSTLGIGASCNITVTFASTAAGSFSAALNVNSNAIVSPASATLSGMADTPVPFSVTAGSGSNPTSPSVTFPSIVAGSVSAGQAVVVTNNGSVPLSLSIAMSGTGANLFNETTTCGASLAVGASCNIPITFAPKVAGSYSATLTLTDNAGSGSQAIPISGTATPFTITVNNSSASGWTIDNGAITFSWNASSGNLTSWVVDGTTDQLVDTTSISNGQPFGLYMDNTGSFANENVPTTGGVAAASTAACTVVGVTIVGTPTTTCTVGTGSTPYFDWSLTIPDSANSGNAYTFVEHWLVFPNDPGVHTYVELIHSTSDAAASVGQVQWLIRDNLSTFTNTYSVNAGLNILGVQNIPQPSVADTSSADPGRVVQNAAEDLHGFTDLPAGFTREFYTKYDYAGYEYLHKGQGVYGVASSGKTYGLWTVIPRIDTFVGGPTKQDLFFTNNIEMIEAYSDHENEPMNLNTAAGVAFNRLFGPFYYHVNMLGTAYNQTGNPLATPADMYADAISAGAAFNATYDTIAPLAAAGYVASTARGSVSVQITGVTGSQYTAWAVLSDPATNFQVSCNGYQYWADISATGATTFTGIVPGTYRLSVYVLGQWGELRQENIVVTANNTTVVPTVAFVPENFGGTATPVFAIGTPDRSAHEFLHGHTANGNDDREFYGNWNYWADFSANQGAVVYYGTAVGSIPATNDLTKWNYNHWGTSFDPGLYAGIYNASDDTTDGYNYIIPAYVATLPGETGTNGTTTGIPAWQVHFATPANYTSEAYVVLSVAVACDEGSYVVALNGHSYTWSRTNVSDCMARSGLSGYTQWFAMQWPTSDLVQSTGGDNVISIGMSQPDGASDDALRVELTNTSASPSVTGWNDYTFLNGTTTLNNDALPNP